MSFRYREQTATLKRVIGVQWWFIGALLLAVFAAGFGWQRALEQQTFYVPPDLRTSSVVTKGEVPPATVFAFAHYIFQQLNRWGSDGGANYGERIFRLQAFLTPGFRDELIRDADERGKNGELTQRTRALHVVPGAEYADDRLDVHSDGSWVVWLDFQIVEHVSGMKVKDTTVRYPLRVVRFDVDRELNTWGLALAGYAAAPERLARAEVAALGGPTR